MYKNNCIEFLGLNGEKSSNSAGFLFLFGGGGFVITVFTMK